MPIVNSIRFRLNEQDNIYITANEKKADALELIFEIAKDKNVLECLSKTFDVFGCLEDDGVFRIVLLTDDDNERIAIEDIINDVEYALDYHTPDAVRQHYKKYNVIPDENTQCELDETGTKLDVFFTENNIDSDLQDDICDEIGDNTYSVCGEVILGFINDERKAKAYFADARGGNFDGEEMAVISSIPSLPNHFIVAGVTDDANNYIPTTVFQELFYAQKFLDSHENILKCSITQEIDVFKRDLFAVARLEFNKRYDFDLGLNIKVNKEYNNGGHFHSFQLFHHNKLMIDNCFELNKDVAGEFMVNIEVLNTQFNGWEICSISKQQENIGFDRFLEVEFVKNDFTTTQTISLRGHPQGQKRNTIDVMRDNIDFDDLNEQYEDYIADKNIVDDVQFDEKGNVIPYSGGDGLDSPEM